MIGIKKLLTKPVSIFFLGVLFLFVFGVACFVGNILFCFSVLFLFAFLASWLWSSKILFLWIWLPILFSLVILIGSYLAFAFPQLWPFLLPVGDVISPGEWLSFWGAFLAALGPIVLSILALWQTKRMKEQNDAEQSAIETQRKLVDARRERLDQEALAGNTYPNIHLLKAFFSEAVFVFSFVMKGKSNASFARDISMSVKIIDSTDEIMYHCDMLYFSAKAEQYEGQDIYALNVEITELSISSEMLERFVGNRHQIKVELCCVLGTPVGICSRIHAVYDLMFVGSQDEFWTQQANSQLIDAWYEERQLDDHVRGAQGASPVVTSGDNQLGM